VFIVHANVLDINRVIVIGLIHCKKTRAFFQFLEVCKYMYMYVLRMDLKSWDLYILLVNSDNPIRLRRECARMLAVVSADNPRHFRDDISPRKRL
jgi:hypothetical protein